jgi:hypothetical protein
MQILAKNTYLNPLSDGTVSMKKAVKMDTRAIDFAAGKNMRISSTFFPRVTTHNETWISLDGKKKRKINGSCGDRLETCHEYK